MDTELKGKYYKSYSEKIDENINKKTWSLHGLHHKNLNRFIQNHIMKLDGGAVVLDAGCGLSGWLTKETEKNMLYRHRLPGRGNKILQRVFSRQEI